MRILKSGGGFPAIRYTFKKAWEAGGLWKLYRAMRSKNACKTCALGMGGQKGGMVNESGSFPEVCKKSLQAMVSDLQNPILPEFWKQHPVTQMRYWSPYQLENSGRLIQPLLYRQGSEHYETITWQQAFDKIATKLKALSADESFWYFSGRSSNEAGFLLQLFARMYGTNNVNNCSYYCHQASGVGLQNSLGTGTATITLEDVEHSDLVFLIGGNPASNHPRLMTTLMHLRRRGGKVVVINPVRETGLVSFKVPSDPRSLLFGTKIASHYYQPHIGGDLALLAGIAKAVVESGAHDANFIAAHCRDSDSYLQYLSELNWQEIESKSGVSEIDIREIAEIYSASKSAVFSWTMGITHHTHGVENVEAIANLALLRGMVGRPGAGMMPIRGHSNVQGIGSVGVTPKLKDAIFKNLTEKFGLQLPTTTGLDTLECMHQAAEGKLKFGFCLGGNLFGSNPDATFAAKALEQLDMLVMLNTTLNTGHANGLAKETIVLPVLARDEEPQATTQESMFNYVRLSDGGPTRLPGPRSEIHVIAAVADRVLGKSDRIDWKRMEDTDAIRQWIGDVVPGYEKIKSIGQDKTEFQIAGRTFHQPQFGTEDGKAVLSKHQLPELKGGAGELRLMTVRSEGQFNTVVYEETDIYRNQDRRDIILLNPSDMDRFGFSHDQRVTVSSATGRMQGVLARSYADIREGNALMYYPESNVLVSRDVDPRSRTPMFKCVLIQLSA